MQEKLEKKFVSQKQFYITLDFHYEFTIQTRAQVNLLIFRYWQTKSINHLCFRCFLVSGFIPRS